MNDDIIKTKLLVTITDKGKDDKILRLYKRHKITYSVSINGIGTASSSLMDYFGLDEIKKNIILSVIPEKLETKLLYDLHNKLELYKPGMGIAFTVGITSATRYLSNQYNGVKFSEEEYAMSKEKEYELIVLIVLEGYSTLAMDAAKRVGAAGGTLIHGIGLGSKEAKKFLGITIEPEKDVVLILTEEKDKKKVMQEMTDAVGLSKEGRGICFSLPVDNVIGLSEKIKFEKKNKKNDIEKKDK
ncbi:MAG: P-II family nitrogen regulator [Bacilli bacterium]|nr:P-II family nitrogen regulator [Bacilli bacterium]